MILGSRGDIDLHIGRLWCCTRRRASIFVLTHAMRIILVPTILPEKRSEL
jgi:hypothetical protein